MRFPAGPRLFVFLGACLIPAEAVGVDAPLLQHDIARLTCGGAVHVFPGSKAEVAANIATVDRAAARIAARNPARHRQTSLPYLAD